ncbi:MAG: hypothetical protein Q9170_004802 [Blastenia crenularia]
MEDNRPSTIDYQKDHDHPQLKYRSVEDFKTYPSLAERPSNQSVLATTRSKNYYKNHRPPSPVTSFLDRIMQDNAQPPKAIDSAHSAHSRDRYSTSQKAYDENHRHHGTSETSVSKLEHANLLKRPAQSPVPLSKHEENTKRQRKDAVNGMAPPKPVAGAKIITDMKEPIDPKIKRRYMDAGTQTEKILIPSSKLTILQEENAIAQMKHSAEMVLKQQTHEAEMVRREQRLALELDHERKMLELRHRFRLPTAQGGPSTSAIATPHSGEDSMVFLTPEANVEDAFSIKAISDFAETGPYKNTTKFTPEFMTNGAARNSYITAEVSPEPRLADQVPNTTAQPTSKPRSSPGSGAKHYAETITRSAKGSVQPSTTVPQKFTGSSRSWSLQIKTSPSPVRDQRNMEVPDRSQRPKVPHLTCHFWKNGHCTKSAAECSYAHHDTGLVASAPDSLKRMKRDGAYYRRGAW